MQGIYKITNIITNKSYIGKSNNINRRFSDHKRLAFTENQKQYDKILYQSIRKYGLNNFIFEIIEELEDYSIAAEREKYWIQYYDSYKNGYNESLGGDGGSIKGHCQGDKNGRAKLTKQDVLFIRQKFKEGCSKKECYEFFKDKISLGGFARVWTGQTWQHIMPEVFTKENIERNSKLGKSLAGKNSRKLSDNEVHQIRQLKQNGLTYQEIYDKINHKVSLSTLKEIVTYKTYKEVK